MRRGCWAIRNGGAPRAWRAGNTCSASWHTTCAGRASANPRASWRLRSWWNVKAYNAGRKPMWRFLAALHGSVAQQILWVQGQMRRRVWEAANVKLKTATLDADTTVHTLYGQQMGARKGYNPKNKGKKSYQPILTFLAETREYLAGELRNGDRPTGDQIARHLRSAFQSLPAGVEKIFARADSGFYCWGAVEAYQKAGCRFIVVARKTSRLVAELNQAQWKPSPKTDADAECEFRVWDGLPAYKSRAMQEYLLRQRGWLTVERLPGYAPDLNPIETMWGNIKGKELANRCAQDLVELDTAVRGGMSRVKQSRTLPFSFLKHAGLSL